MRWVAAMKMMIIIMEKRMRRMRTMFSISSDVQSKKIEEGKSIGQDKRVPIPER